MCVCVWGGGGGGGVHTLSLPAKTVYLKFPVAPNTTKYSHRMDKHWFVAIDVVVGDDNILR